MEEKHGVLDAVYEGEKLVERVDGSRVARDATPEAELSVDGNGETGGETGVAESVGDVEETVMEKRPRGRPKKVQKRNHGAGRPKEEGALTGAGAGEQPVKRGRGRPRKNAA